MKRPFHITAVRNDEPDLDRFVAALAAVVMARLEEEEAARPETEDGGD